MLAFFILYGILIGSFLNVLILRIPKGEDFVKKSSHCMHCDYNLKWYDLVPVLSYITLGGKCRQCKTHISLQYPLIELLNGAAYGVIFVLNGFNWHTVLYCGMFSVLLVITMIDLRHMLIPNGLVVAVLLLGVVETFLTKNYVTNIIGFFAVSSILLLLAILTRGGMGGGDIKLMAAAGLFLGWQKVILALMIGAIVGSLIGVTLIALKRIARKQMIPFGPFLCSGIVIAMLFGDLIIQRYIALIVK